MKTSKAPNESKPLSAAELVSEFGRQRDEIITVNVLLSERDAKRNALLLSGTDADVLDHDRDTATLRLRRDRATARLEAIRREHPLAVARELEAERVALRTGAERQREIGKVAYERVETKLREVFDDLAIVFAADQVIATANANLPAGAQPLRPVEADYRWRAGIASTTELVPRQGGGEATVRVIAGRTPLLPEPLYNVFECPALRPDDATLRVPGTPTGPAGPVVKILKATSELPAMPTTENPADGVADTRGSAFRNARLTA